MIFTSCQYYCILLQNNSKYYNEKNIVLQYILTNYIRFIILLNVKIVKTKCILLIDKLYKKL